MKTDKYKQETTQQHSIYYKQLLCARKSFVRARAFMPISARQITRRVGVICRAERWVRKIVVSHKNGQIQAGNDTMALHLLQTITMCTKIFCKSPQIHQKICSTNNDTSRRYFSSCSTNNETSRRYFSSRTMAKKNRCFS